MVPGGPPTGSGTGAAPFSDSAPAGAAPFCDGWRENWVRYNSA